MNTHIAYRNLGMLWLPYSLFRWQLTISTIKTHHNWRHRPSRRNALPFHTREHVTSARKSAIETIKIDIGHRIQINLMICVTGLPYKDLQFGESPYQFNNTLLAQDRGKCSWAENIGEDVEVCNQCLQWFCNAFPHLIAYPTACMIAHWFDEIATRSLDIA